MNTNVALRRIVYMLTSHLMNACITWLLKALFAAVDHLHACGVDCQLLTRTPRLQMSPMHACLQTLLGTATTQSSCLGSHML